MVVLNRKELEYLDLSYLGGMGGSVIFDSNVVDWLKDSNDLEHYANGAKIDYTVEFERTDKCNIWL